jgi:type I restriction enzyme M protein
MNQQALSAFIWSVADLLRGDYKPADYDKVKRTASISHRIERHADEVAIPPDQPTFP